MSYLLNQSLSSVIYIKQFVLLWFWPLFSFFHSFVHADPSSRHVSLASETNPSGSVPIEVLIQVTLPANVVPDLSPSQHSPRCSLLSFLLHFINISTLAFIRLYHKGLKMCLFSPLNDKVLEVRNFVFMFGRSMMQVMSET